MLKSKFLVSLLITSFVFFFSCDSSDESIEGTYKITSFTSAGCDDPEENVSFDFSANDGCSTILGLEVCGDGTLTLTEAGSFNFTITVTSVGQSFSQSGSGTYSVEGNTITICDGDDCESTTFTLGSGKISIQFSDESDACVLTINGEKK